MHGTGTFTWKDRTQTYSGSFEFGKMQPNGTLTFVDGSSFTGPFLDGVPHGKGRYKYPMSEVCGRIYHAKERTS